MKYFFLLIRFIIFLCLTVVISCQQEKNNNESFVEVIKIYYNTGELKYEISMKDSLLHGRSTVFYKNGVIKNIKDYHDDVPINDHYHYSLDGKLITYYLFNLRGEVRYKLYWDSTKKSYIQEGKGLYVKGNFKGNYATNDTIKLIPIIANPFKLSYNVIFILEDQEIRRTYKSSDPRAPLLIYSIKDGSNLIKVKSEIFEGENSMLRTDSISINLMGS